jgi:hypothetical protein
MLSNILYLNCFSIYKKEFKILSKNTKINIDKKLFTKNYFKNENYLILIKIHQE